MTRRDLIAVLLLWLLPIQAWAALALDGTPATAYAGTGSTIALTITTTQSNDVLIFAILPNDGNPASGISGGGLTWTKRTSTVVCCFPNNIDEWWAIAPSPLTGVTITATLSSSTFYSGALFAISGANTSTPYDVNGSLPVTGIGNTPLTLSTTNADTFIINEQRFASTSSPTPDAGWTGIASGGGGYFLVEYKIVSSPQTSLTISSGSTGSSAVIGDAIQIAGATPTYFPSTALFPLGQ